MTEIEREIMALGLDGKDPDSAPPVILRAAQAIVEAAGIEDAGGRPHTFDTVSHHYREAALRDAAAAILSLREPTEAMVGAGNEAGEARTYGAVVADSDRLRQIWRAMIDAALGRGER